jgi:hypothetical protein
MGDRALISGLPEISNNNAQVGQARLACDFAHADAPRTRGRPPYGWIPPWRALRCRLAATTKNTKRPERRTGAEGGFRASIPSHADRARLRDIRRNHGVGATTVSRAAGARRRRLSGRRRDRRDRAGGQPAARRDVGPAGRDREQGWGGHPDRHRVRRQGGGRRLHAARHLGRDLRVQPFALSQAQLRRERAASGSSTRSWWRRRACRSRRSPT